MGWKRSYPRAGLDPVAKAGGALMGLGGIVFLSTAAFGAAGISALPFDASVDPVTPAPAHHSAPAAATATQPQAKFITYTEAVPCADKPAVLHRPTQVVHHHPIHRRKLATPIHHVVVRPHAPIRRPVRHLHRPPVVLHKTASCEVLHRDGIGGPTQLVAAAYYPNLGPIGAAPLAPSNALDRSFSPLNPLNNYPEFPSAGGRRATKLATVPPVTPPVVTPPATPVSAAPEPGTWALMIVGLAMIGMGFRYRNGLAAPPTALKTAGEVHAGDRL